MNIIYKRINHKCEHLHLSLYINYYIFTFNLKSIDFRNTSYFNEIIKMLLFIYFLLHKLKLDHHFLILIILTMVGENNF
jgi:hypothetical protein